MAAELVPEALLTQQVEGVAEAVRGLVVGIVAGFQSLVETCLVEAAWVGQEEAGDERVVVVVADFVVVAVAMVAEGSFDNPLVAAVKMVAQIVAEAYQVDFGSQVDGEAAYHYPVE